MKESDFWRLVRVSLQNVCSTDVHLTRIENIGGGGVSDVNMCLHGSELWIELKMARGNQVQFQPSQLAWISRHIACGGRVFVLVRKKNEMRLYLGEDAINLSRNLEVAPIFSTTKPFNWRGLVDTLVGMAK